jgi:protein arginine kinase activator
MQPRDEIVPICPMCGMSQKEFSQGALAGCSECYNVFETTINATLLSMGCQLPYQGEVPQQNSQLSSILDEKRECMAQMKKAADEHNYEMAVALRNKLKEMAD